MTTDFSLARDLMEQLDEWTNNLAAPLLPPIENSVMDRLEFRQNTPEAVMIGKCVRAVSGIHAALALADLGYVVECATILRMVSDFCTESMIIGKGLRSGGELPSPVRTFVEQYFTPRPRTPDQYKKTQRSRYVSRRELMKAETRLDQMAGIHNEQIGPLHEFLNSGSDAYVHGAYETAMELYDPDIGRFRMRGDRDPSQHRNYVEWVSLKLHEVVCALEITAEVTGHEEVWKATRDARRALDGAEWSQIT